MILDKNGKVFGKFNVVDFSVVLAIVIAVLGIIGRFVIPIGGAVEKEEVVKTDVEVSYVLQMDALRIFSIDALMKKGPLIELSNGKEMGEITNVEYVPYKSDYINKDGDIIKMELPENYTAFVTIKSKGYETDKGYFIGENSELLLGTEVYLASKYVNVTGVVKSIEKLN